jgi:F-type H+-transporting ATPase subunit epsilon
MQSSALMHLKILLPFQVFLDETKVESLIAESIGGSLGLLPHRLDCTAALSPGILIYKNESGRESYIATDDGVLVKTGLDVFVSVRNAVAGPSLSELQKTVKDKFIKETSEELKMRNAMEAMESSFIRRLTVLKNER